MRDLTKYVGISYPDSLCHIMEGDGMREEETGSGGEKE